MSGMCIDVAHVNKRFHVISSKVGNLAVVKSRSISKTIPLIKSLMTHDIAKTRLKLHIYTGLTNNNDYDVMFQGKSSRYEGSYCTKIRRASERHVEWFD